jgi:aminoglycoside phosphotransferase (APT) family kinase protein
LVHQEFAPVETLGFDPAELLPAQSVTNQVWIAGDFVLKISSGRFRGGLWHERRVLELAHTTGGLHSDLFPVVRRYGVHGRGEWLVMSRAEGRCLRDVWPGLSSAQRLDAMRQAGDVLRAFHALPADGMEPPWLRDAIDRQDVADIYHCPFEDHEALLANIPADSVAVRSLPQIRRYLKGCSSAFAAAPSRGLVHGDVHFANLMWADGKVTALLDFEGTRASAPVDQELDMMLRQLWDAEAFGAHDSQHSEADRDAAVSALLDSYPALFNEGTNKRLTAYGIMSWLNAIHHFSEDSLLCHRSILDIAQISKRNEGQFHTYILPLDLNQTELVELRS